MSLGQLTAPVARALPFRALGEALARAERRLFWLTLILAAGMNWLAPRLPMVDLPQHAAQVALWRDLLLGQSPWSDLVYINLLTPYLIGYGLTLPLAFVFSIDVATRIVLTAAFLAFVGMSVLLRRHFGSDRRLDWLFLLSFHGFAWKWGFYTFLAASPMGLLFLLLAARHAARSTAGSAATLVAAGALLLFSHGLLFIAGLFLGGMLTLEPLWRQRGRTAFLLLAPFAVLALMCLAFRMATMQLDGSMQLDAIHYGDPLWLRPSVLLISVSDLDVYGTLLMPVATVAAFWMPGLFGLKLNGWGPRLLAAGLLIILAATPFYAFQTDFLYKRFALFIPPIFALVFRASDRRGPGSDSGMAALAVLMAASWTVLAIQASRIAAFAAESRPFETLLRAAQPGKRALGLSFDKTSPAAANNYVYMHYAAWYQAEKHGFSDYNFAVFHPQVVRFRPGKDPEIPQDLPWRQLRLDWSEIDARLYDYFFLRASPAQLEATMRDSPCRLKMLAQDGAWVLLERQECPASYAGR